jgi:hypothetical protein
MEGNFSEWKPIHAGEPQGAVLVPLLYNVYVADIPMDHEYKYHNSQTTLPHSHRI